MEKVSYFLLVMITMTTSSLNTSPNITIQRASPSSMNIQRSRETSSLSTSPNIITHRLTTQSISEFQSQFMEVQGKQGRVSLSTLLPATSKQERITLHTILHQESAEISIQSSPAFSASSYSATPKKNTPNIEQSALKFLSTTSHSLIPSPERTHSMSTSLTRPMTRLNFRKVTMSVQSPLESIDFRTSVSDATLTSVYHAPPSSLKVVSTDKTATRKKLLPTQTTWSSISSTKELVAKLETTFLSTVAFTKQLSINSLKKNEMNSSRMPMKLTSSKISIDIMNFSSLLIANHAKLLPLSMAETVTKEDKKLLITESSSEPLSTKRSGKLSMLVRSSKDSFIEISRNRIKPSISSTFISYSFSAPSTIATNTEILTKYVPATLPASNSLMKSLHLSSSSRSTTSKITTTKSISSSPAVETLTTMSMVIPSTDLNSVTQSMTDNINTPIKPSTKIHEAKSLESSTLSLRMSSSTTKFTLEEPTTSCTSVTQSTTSPDHPQGWWSEWSLAVPCLTVRKNEHFTLFERICQNNTNTNNQQLKHEKTFPLNNTCIGNTVKSIPCEATLNAPFTESKTAKAFGFATLKKFAINGTIVSTEHLRHILNKKGLLFQQLKTSVQESLLELHKNSNFFVERIGIQNITVGSLKIEYLIVLSTNNQTLEDLKISRNGNIYFFPKHSVFDAETSKESFQISDYNPCEDHVTPCDTHAHCYKFQNRLSFGCQCMQGFEGDGFQCEKILSETSKSKVQTGIVILIALVIILIIILVAVMVIFCGKKKSREVTLRTQEEHLVKRNHEDLTNDGERMESTFNEISYGEDERLTTS